MKVSFADGTFRVGAFDTFRAPLSNDDRSEMRKLSISSMGTIDLLRSDNPEYNVEGQWRIAPIFTIFIICLMQCLCLWSTHDRDALPSLCRLFCFLLHTICFYCQCAHLLCQADSLWFLASTLCLWPFSAGGYSFKSATPFL
ncbi:hypothetical protein [Anaerobiospirillum thomasii]|uniref:Uncharacterized protein n=1 Tax=Anaerobiospirillum thomasii TaxID=179995 RepID=A0A2X0WBT4_9GAMM|nr:hypothetical protein [Anaerobiospirillum thomasii]SPT78948.1 Uncharacterised protein [Anaerobiospirillum thomasii]